MNKTEWLCRDCEVDVEKMIIHAERVPNEVVGIGSLKQGSVQVVISKDGTCEVCGSRRRLFEYEAPEKAPEAVLVAESEEEAGDADIVSRLEEVLEETEEALEEVSEAIDDKEEKIKQIEAMLAELKGE